MRDPAEGLSSNEGRHEQKLRRKTLSHIKGPGYRGWAATAPASGVGSSTPQSPDGSSHSAGGEVMWKSRRLWPRFLVLCVSCALVPGMATLAQERELVFEQIVGRARGLPQLSPQGEWGEVINATSRWVVIQHQSGQQYPIAVDNLGEFLVRWPSSVDALGVQSVVEGFGQD